MRLFDLSGRTAVVVGGTSGIGRTLALGLAEAGADVVATGRRIELVKDVAAEIQRHGRRTLSIAADVSDMGSLERLRDVCIETFGRVDILLAVAGMTKKSPTLEMDEADWQRVIETNLTGTLRACQVFGRPMIAQKYGRIVTIGSLSSFVGLFEVAAYVASKAGGRRSDAGARGRVGAAQRHGQRPRARALSDRPQRGAARFAAGAGVPDADADEALRAHRGTGRRRRVPLVRGRIVRDGTHARRRRRLPGERSQPVKPVLVISERDNVATALQALEPGRDLTLDNGVVSVRDAVPSGHKIALRVIRAGEAVIKYGSPIGLATVEIPAGSHVHTHNLASTRGRGDLEGPRSEPQPRLAEPPDERNGVERNGAEKR